MSKHPEGILSGHRVVDFTWVWAGPTVTSVLADLGAEVVKVESEVSLDYNRLRALYHKQGNITITDDNRNLLEVVSMFENVNRNKLSVTINIQTKEGSELAKELIRKSDIVVENFRPGVLEKAGLDYASIKKAKPDIIMLSMSGAGQKGPLKNLAAYGPSITSLVGLESIVGYRNEEPTGMLSIGYSDPSSGMHAIVALLSAIFHRSKTGEGQYIDVSEIDSMAVLMGEAFLDYEMNKRVMGPVGNDNPVLAPHGTFPCVEEDRWVSIAVGSDEEWAALCDTLKKPEWKLDQDFSDQYHRHENRDKLNELLSAETAKYPLNEIIERLQKKGVAAAPVLNVEELSETPYFKQRQFQLDVTHQIKGPSKVVSIPWKMGQLGPKVERSSPLLGEHNSYVFGELLGMSAAQINELKNKKVIF